MKKLMVCAAMLMAGVVAQAASMAWTAFPFDVTQTDMGSYTPLSFKWVVVETATADNSGISFANGVLTGADAISGGGAEDIQTPNVFGGETMVGNIAGATVGKYYSLLLWQEDNQHWGISDAALAVVDPGDPTQSALQSVNFTNGVDPMGAGAPSVVTAESVPEPTSGLLLLLGVAGLALRRRRA